MSPHISTVVGNIDRDIAHYADAALVAVGLQVIPLPTKLELPVLENLYLVRQRRTPFFQGCRVPSPDCRFPIRPYCASVNSFTRHKQSVVIQPGGIVAAEGLKFGALWMPIICQEFLGSSPEHS